MHAPSPNQPLMPLHPPLHQPLHPLVHPLKPPHPLTPPLPLQLPPPIDALHLPVLEALRRPLCPLFFQAPPCARFPADVADTPAGDAARPGRWHRCHPAASAAPYRRHPGSLPPPDAGVSPPAASAGRVPATHRPSRHPLPASRRHQLPPLLPLLLLPLPPAPPFLLSLTPAHHPPHDRASQNRHASPPVPRASG